MNGYQIININTYKEELEIIAEWFSSKWNIDKNIYLESFKEALNENSLIPSWYIVLNNEKIIGGIGVIDNDYHERIDLTPNVCALYVEEEYRNKGIAGKLLNFVIEEMKSKGIKKLYLITDHTNFYEKYGWKYLFDVKCDDGNISRIYSYDVLKNNLRKT